MSNIERGPFQLFMYRGLFIFGIGDSKKEEWLMLSVRILWHFQMMLLQHSNYINYYNEKNAYNLIKITCIFCCKYYNKNHYKIDWKNEFTSLNPFYYSTTNFLYTMN